VAGRWAFGGLCRLEYEFFVFKETPESVAEKNYRGTHADGARLVRLLVIRNSTGSEFYRRLLDSCREMDMPIEGLHEETGPGVMEAAIAVDQALSAADKAALFKTFAKVIAQKSGYMATFMAKVSKDWPGRAATSTSRSSRGRVNRCSTRRASRTR